MQVSGEVLYNGYGLNEFVSQSTSAYIEQVSLMGAQAQRGLRMCQIHACNQS